MRHPIQHTSPLDECLGKDKPRISKIHLRFHEILVFRLFLLVLHPFRVLSPVSNDVPIVPNVLGLSWLAKMRSPTIPSTRTLVQRYPTLDDCVWMAWGPLSHRTGAVMVRSFRMSLGQLVGWDEACHYPEDQTPVLLERYPALSELCSNGCYRTKTAQRCYRSWMECLQRHVLYSIRLNRETFGNVTISRMVFT